MLFCEGLTKAAFPSADPGQLRLQSGLPQLSGQCPHREGVPTTLLCGKNVPQGTVFPMDMTLMVNLNLSSCSVGASATWQEGEAVREAQTSPTLWGLCMYVKWTDKTSESRA